jgi:hypothetical protein
MDHCIQALQNGIKIYQASHGLLYFYNNNDELAGFEVTKDNRAALTKILKGSLDKLADVGIVIPVVFDFVQKGDKYNCVLGGHLATIGIRKESGSYFVTQYNTGLGAVGTYKTEFSTDGGLIPLVLRGEAAVVFGPYDEESVLDFIIQTQKLSKRCYSNSSEAGTAFKKLFDPKLRLPHGRPTRRFQITGNCMTASIREWLVDVFQRHRKVKLFNEFDAFGQIRGTGQPSLEKAEEGGIDGERFLKLKFEDADENWEQLTF